MWSQKHPGLLLQLRQTGLQKTIILSQQILVKLLPLYFQCYNFVNKFNVYTQVWGRVCKGMCADCQLWPRLSSFHSSFHSHFFLWIIMSGRHDIIRQYSNDMIMHTTWVMWGLQNEHTRSCCYRVKATYFITIYGMFLLVQAGCYTEH